MYRHLLIVAALLVVVSSPVLSEEPAPLSSHEMVARDLYQLLGARAGAEALLQMVRNNPELAPYEDVFQTWYQNVFADGEFEADVISLYTNAFTEQELREMIAFYQTPLGQKILLQLPQLIQQGMELGMKRGQDHNDELEAMLAQAKQERESPTEAEAVDEEQ